MLSSGKPSITIIALIILTQIYRYVKPLNIFSSQRYGLIKIVLDFEANSSNNMIVFLELGRWEQEDPRPDYLPAAEDSHHRPQGNQRSSLRHYGKVNIITFLFTYLDVKSLLFV